MSAHFDGGAEIAGRRLRDVEVSYVDDPTLDLGDDDSDDCPASPPPTYYLRVREEKRGMGTGRGAVDGGGGGNGSSVSSGSDSCDGQRDGGDEGRGQHDSPECESEDNNTDGSPENDRTRHQEDKNKTKNGNKKWSWRYVNVEKKCLLVWDRRGGRLLRSIHLRDVESLVVLPDQDAPASILEVYIASPAPNADAGCRTNNSTIGNNKANNIGGVSGGDGSSGHEGPPGAGAGGGDAQRQRHQGGGGEGLRHGDPVDGGVLVLQARSRRETLLWAKVLQENVELMTRRRVPLENRDEETSLSDVQQLAKLLTHQLSELQRREGGNGKCGSQQRESSGAVLMGANSANAAANGAIPEGVEGDETES
eukprot:g18470.t1